MSTQRTLVAVVLFLLTAGLMTGLAAEARSSADLDASLEVGTPRLKSAGVLAFGPEGILFVADSRSAAIFALDTEDDEPRDVKKPINVAAIDKKVAAAVGSSPERVGIHDLAVNPVSGKAYLSASRGQGPDATPLILRLGAGGELEVLSLEKIKFAKALLPNAPDEDATDRRGRSLRSAAITDLAYVDQSLLVTGISNEEFSSKLRVLPFPFGDVDAGTSVEIFHANHGRWETNAPVRTFVRYDIEAEPYVLAAYTCTPLVKFPVSELVAGTKLVGTTVAELGNRNRPLDMIVYRKSGKDYLLMANNSRGVMKIDLEDVDSIEGITERVGGIAGLPYETVAELEGVKQLDLLDPDHALILVETEDGHDLKTVALP